MLQAAARLLLHRGRQGRHRHRQRRHSLLQNRAGLPEVLRRREWTHHDPLLSILTLKYY